jgi:DHA3 family macrolide efflux protein-like MFS transporter
MPTFLREMRVFLLLWLGQVVSTVGSSLTGFVLGVWVYQLTGSATQFALIAACAVLPGILLSPVAGAIVDRHDRRHVMILADVGAALSTGVLALLYVGGMLDVWHIWVATFITACCNAFQNPAYSASLVLLVPKKHLGRANGLVQTGHAMSIIAPVVAAGLVASIGIPGVIAIDLGTFLFAMLLLALIRIPRPAPSAAGAVRGSIWREAAVGWTYLRDRPGLMWLAVLFGFFNFFIGISAVMVQPLILSFASIGVLGWLMMAGGSGMLAGSLTMSAWGGPKRRIHGVLGFLLLGGFALFLHGLAPSALLIAFVAPAFLFTIPIMSGSCFAILQTRVAPDVQGRVFATTRMLSMSAMPLAYLLAGPLADRVFEPAMAPGGALAGTLGAWIGVGEGRGIAVIFMMSGLVLMATAVVAYLSPVIRNVEDDQPEPALEPAAAPAAEPATALAGD